MHVSPTTDTSPLLPESSSISAELHPPASGRTRSGDAERPAAEEKNAANERSSFYAKFKLQGARKSAGRNVAPIEIDGTRLAPEQVVQIARHDAQVAISDEAMQRVQQGFDVVLQAAAQGKPVYGLTTGVGKNKDRAVFARSGDGTNALSEEMLARSREFNLTSIRAHSSGTGDPMSREIVRAGMLIRLNTLLSGAGGVQPAVVECLKEFLNKDITPLMPECGSIGEGDLLLMGHAGMVMAGEWWVVPANQKEGEATPEEVLESAGLDPESRACPRRIVHASEALAEAGIDPVQLVGKDFLSIISTNSLTAGNAVLGVHDAAEFLARETFVFALCLQGLNGNVAPFLQAAAKARAFPEMNLMATAVRAALEDSSLWRPDPKRPLQDPISYRAMGYRLGEVMRGIDDTARALQTQINHSDDNPCVSLNHDSTEAISGQEQMYVVAMGNEKHAIVPTANFESLPFVAPMEQLLRGLGGLATTMANNVMRFESDAITGLPRFLIASPNGHGFGAVSKGTVALNDEIDAETTPGRSTNIPVAGGQLEDMATAGPVNARKLRSSITQMYRMASYQLLYATQAYDLHGGAVQLSPATRELYEQYRQKVPFVAEDRQTTSALAAGVKVLKNWP